jgi:hypothetical protein
VSGELARTRTKVAGAVLAALAVLSAGALAGAQAAEDGGGDGATPRAGSSSPTESNFVPITPCRIVNTQNSAGKLAVGEVRSYRVHGNTSSQGGAAACGIPSVATALEVSITAVKAEGNGYLRVYPFGQAEPNATFLNYTNVFNAENAGTVRVASGPGNNLSVKAYQRPTHVVVDVLGYYVANLMAVSTGNGGLLRSSGALSILRVSDGTYEVRFERVVVGCAFTGGLHDISSGAGTEGDIAIAISSQASNGIRVETYNEAGTKSDSEFHVVVTC